MADKPSYEDLVLRVKELEKQHGSNRQVEGELMVNEERLAQIIQGISIPTFVIDKDHHITHYNRAMQNLTGIPAKAIIGTRKQWMVFYETERPIMADLIVDNATEEEIEKYYGQSYLRSEVLDGAYEAEGFFPDLGEDGKWLYFTAAPLKDAEGNITAAVETLQDITQRKRAENDHLEAERRYRTFLDFAPYPIVVFSLEGMVTYLNPAFTETFGWRFDELEGKRIPYVPPELQKETSENIKKLFEEKVILRHETKRLTKDGKLLDVIMRGAVFYDREGNPEGELVILRDVTQQKRIERNNETMLRISMSLPNYPDLYDLLNYVSREIKDLLDAEGGVVVLVDEERQEVFFPGVAYDDSATQRRVKEIRFPMEHADQVIALKVLLKGEPIIVNDTSKIKKSFPLRDKKMGYQTKSFLQVPLKSQDRIIGVLAAINKKEGEFDQTDMELLNMIAGTVALSIENARFAEELKKAYREVTSMNRAKDKVINHLSHELKTPVSVLHASLLTLAKRIKDLPESTWKPTIERARRNLERILQIQYQADDIIQGKEYRIHRLLSLMVDECADEIEALLAEEVGEGPNIKRLREKIDEIFGLKEIVSTQIHLDRWIKGRVDLLRPLFSHRDVEIDLELESVPAIMIPEEVIQKVFDGLVKNAVENSPDESRIEIRINKRGEGVELTVRDYGVGITEDAKRRIFEGFFTTQDTMAYSSKRPFDFNAGGKGADLLRMKIFSERYHFAISMTSWRCPAIPKDGDVCPGRISACFFCKDKVDCRRSGGTTFTLVFSPAPS